MNTFNSVGAVTGGASGLSRAMAKRLLAQGLTGDVLIGTTIRLNGALRLPPR